MSFVEAIVAVLILVLLGTIAFGGFADLRERTEYRRQHINKVWVEGHYEERL